MNRNIDALNQIHERVKELNRQNNQLRRNIKTMPNTPVSINGCSNADGLNLASESERKIFEALQGVKQDADEQVLQNTQILDNESYFDRMMMPLVIDQFKNQQKINLNPEASKYINQLVVKEYMNEFNTGVTCVVKQEFERKTKATDRQP